MPDLSALYGQHVRLRPANSPAKPTARIHYGDSFGTLVDLGSATHAGLETRYRRGQVNAFQIDNYRIDPYPRRRVRVFFYPYDDNPFWTWCREIGGDVLDDVGGLKKYDYPAEAFWSAHEWLVVEAAKDVLYQEAS